MNKTVLLHTRRLLFRNLLHSKLRTGVVAFSGAGGHIWDTEGNTVLRKSQIGKLFDRRCEDSQQICAAFRQSIVSSRRICCSVERFSKVTSSEPHCWQDSSDAVHGVKLHLANEENVEKQLGLLCGADVKSSTTATTKVTESKNIDMSKLTVNHDVDKKCFYIKPQVSEQSVDQQEQLAKLVYKWVTPELVEMYHTEVPPQFQGQGIAKLLAKAAFDAFSEQGVTMRPTCSYLRKYLRENPLPQYMDKIEKGFKL